MIWSAIMRRGRSRVETLADAGDVEEPEIAPVVVDDDHYLRRRAHERVERVAQRVLRPYHDREARRVDLVETVMPFQRRGADPAAWPPVVQHRDPVDAFALHHRARVRRRG